MICSIVLDPGRTGDQDTVSQGHAYSIESPLEREGCHAVFQPWKRTGCSMLDSFDLHKSAIKMSLQITLHAPYYIDARALLALR